MIFVRGFHKKTDALKFEKYLKKLRNKSVRSFETQRITKDGRTLDIWLTVTRLLDDAGELKAVATTEHDIASVKAGKAVDRFVHNSETVTDVKQTFFNGDPEYFQSKLTQFASQFNMSFDDVKDLSVTALIGKMLTMADTDESRSELTRMLDAVTGSSLATQKIASIAGGLSDGRKA